MAKKLKVKRDASKMRGAIKPGGSSDAFRPTGGRKNVEGKKKKNLTAKSSKDYGSKVSAKSFKPAPSVRMANPAANKRFGRNKRHGNPDLSDADSLPSESDEEDSDADLPSSGLGKSKSKDDPTDVASDSDVEEFLEEDYDEGKPAESLRKSNQTRDDIEHDESEDEEAKDSVVRVTTKLALQWGKALQEKPTPANLKTVTRSFLAAVTQITGQNKKNHGYRVEGGPAFNAVVSMCLRCVGPALSKLLKIGVNSKPKEKIVQLKKNKKWKSLHVPVRSYLTCLTELVTRLHEESVVRRVLRHISDLLPYFSCNPKASKMLFKHLIQLWSSGKESLRLPAFMALLRFVRMNGDEWLLPAIKKMYVAYVSNSKQTTPSTWPTIGFMASSLVEILSIKPDITYQQAFVYIRQMAIHVRNATNQKNKETQGKVYNWPFMHCIYLWSKLVSDVYPSPALMPLVHPLVQVIMCTIKVNPVKKFYPLMFHCVRALTLISSKTDIFIPTIPVLLSSLQTNDLNKRPKTTSFKPLEFMCMLKFSASQLSESNYRIGVADQVYELMVEYLRTQSHRIGFTELVVVPCVQVRKFLKDCKVAEIGKKFKHLLHLMEEQSSFISERRKRIQFKFTDLKDVDAWEKETQTTVSPFSKFYSTWKEARKTALAAVQADLEGRVKSGGVGGDEDEPGNDDVEHDFWAEAEAVQELPAKTEQTEDESLQDKGDTVVTMGQLSDEEEADDVDTSDEEQ